ncbi:MAG: hypothetical protein BWY67_00133 [Bacteroidetes bacterium ADurb.Bin397]|nr:MAG: hypothetical protein BWY67_00133 [Bacteroidetes bacterium ADurb.Bin397]
MYAFPITLSTAKILKVPIRLFEPSTLIKIVSPGVSPVKLRDDASDNAEPLSLHPTCVNELQVPV